MNKRLLLYITLVLFCGGIKAQDTYYLNSQNECVDSVLCNFINLHVDKEKLVGNRFFCVRWYLPILLCIECDSEYVVYIGERNNDIVQCLTFPRNNTVDTSPLKGIYDSISREKHKEFQVVVIWRLTFYGEDGRIIDKMYSDENSLTDTETRYIHSLLFNYFHYIGML